MNAEHIHHAYDETVRFLAKITALKLEADELMKKSPHRHQWNPSGPMVSAVRRASMDLTRALAELRRYR